MAWYKTGTITVTNGSTTVTGSGTSWITGAGIGEALYAPDGRIYEIANIVSATQLTLGSAYLGTTASGQAYQIVPTQSYIRDLAQQAAQLVADYAGIASNAGTGKFSDGTLASPGIRFVSDEDTGFFRSGSNEVKFVAGGVEQFKFNSSGMSSTTPTVFSVNSSSDALRITQTGAGNALVVEDSANPDSTPFVVDAGGNVISGNTRTIAAGSSTPQSQLHSTSGTTAAVFNWGVSGADPSRFVLAKSNSGAVETRGSVASGTRIGLFRFMGDDGTSFIDAATIDAYVDGVPGTNDMPGRLVFNTTADGTNTSVERMRIDSRGAVGIGSTVLATSALRLGTSITGGTTAYGAFWGSAVQPTVTTAANYHATAANTASNGGVAYTIAALRHYQATQGTFHADSIVTSQSGFDVSSGLIGATNNYGFYSNIPSGTGRWNFYANGTAANYFAGQTLIGNSTAQAFNFASTPRFQVSGTSQSTSAITSFTANSINASPASLLLGRSRGTQASPTIVSNGDEIGIVQFEAHDGAALIPAARIRAEVDGTPATNDMPGRLVFSTTADGASSPTERMRIDSAGNVGIGTTSISGYGLRVSKADDTANFVGVGSTGNSNSTSTNSYKFYSVSATAANAGTPYTITSIRHYDATQATFNADSTVTNQYGFIANSSLTGATNNYGFYSSIASGTGRWNFYANGTAANYFGGNVLVKSTVQLASSTTLVPSLQVVSTGLNELPIMVQHFGANANSAQVLFSKTRGASAGSYNSAIQSNDGLMFIAAEGSDGVSALRRATAIGAVAAETFTATSSPGYLYFSTTPSGSTSVVERMRIDSEGRVGIGGTPGGDTSVLFGRNITGSTTSYGVRGLQTVQSDVTATAYGYISQLSTAAASFTVSGGLQYFAAAQGSFGAGSSVANQYGFNAQASLIGATNNYGFYSNIPSGTGRWNFYANGTAANYFAGNTQIANYLDVTTVLAAGFGLRVRGESGGTYAGIQFTNNAANAQWAKIVSPSANVLTFQDGGNTERMRIDSAGNVGIGTSSPSCVLDVVGGIKTSRTAVTAPAASDGNVFSGTYTPTLTNGANVFSSTAYSCQYMRVGNTVTVSGSLVINPTAANTYTVVKISLPIASNFTDAIHCRGTSAILSTTASELQKGSGCIYADVTNDVAELICAPETSGSGKQHAFTFTYRIL